ncbi:PREDICTED: probable ADP-ribosylation factor GTPase-activating protein AGD8 [Camelina sativa]|uniref:Probable ADP-ribosylation factor GTPase-activating protein AGD8 n=1 Tax=Camelina sativa TaxID=90675 RepID=A0ABM1QH30_CAMSA|nr:PREDICTED: probable ADP-ribosylation factor GTPase-activating protein AGD8 [Camelina sativa]
MMFGGNNRAQVFFKQHGWTDDGKIEAKYTSRAAALYRQILATGVDKVTAEEIDAALPSSPVVPKASNEVSSCAVKEELPPPKHEITSATSSTPYVPSTSKKLRTIGARRAGKTGGLGAQKLTTKGNLYDQKPDKVIPASSFNVHLRSQGQSGADAQVPSHVAPPKPSSSSSSLFVQVEESVEARKKFSNAKSISSAQFFGDENISDNLPSKTTLEVNKDMWLSLSKVGKIKDKLVGGILGADVCGLRKEVTELKQKLHAQDADGIPIATRRDWVHKVCDQITVMPCHIYFLPIYGDILRSTEQDMWALMDELYGTEVDPDSILAIAD